MRSYTERFFHWRGGGAQFTWTVPQGKRAVVRNILAQNRATAAGAIELTAAGYSVLNASLPAQGNYEVLETRVVVYAGELMQLNTGGTDTSCWVSGYLFDDSSSGRDAPAPEGGLITKPAPA